MVINTFKNKKKQARLDHGNVPHKVWSDPIHFLAFGFGSGLSPYAPGTFGTIAAIPLFLVLENLSLTFYVLVVIALTIFGIWICDVTARDLGVKDYQGIVWDEIVGYLCTMIAVPASLGFILMGFLLFRLFDMFKPWPVYLAERLPGGYGIVLDDVLAAAYAWLILQGIRYFFF